MDRGFKLTFILVLFGALAMVGLALLLPRVELARIANPNTLMPFALSLVVLAVFARRPA